MKRWDLVAGALAILAVAAAIVQLVFARGSVDLVTLAIVVTVSAPAVVLGVIIARRRPSNPVGALLTLVGTGTNVAIALENLRVQPFAEMAWMLHYVGPTLLLLFFPTGTLLSRRWRVVAALAGALPVVAVVVVSLLPRDVSELILPIVVLVLLATLALAVVAVAIRYRRGDDELRRQLRWLALTAVLLPAALVLCWVGAIAGLGAELVGIALGALYLCLGLSVGIALLRHRLYGVDRVLAGTVRWVLLIAALGVVFAVSTVLAGILLGGGSPIVAVVATAAAAIVFGLIHRRIREWVDARFRPHRARLLDAIRGFAADVAAGRRPPEMLAEALGGAVVVVPRGEILGLAAAPDAALTPADVADLEAAARLPLELIRLRTDLRTALRETDASRARLVAAADDERRRIQQDLHDGAQSNLVALGMRLRQLQRRHPDEAELGESVELVQRTISDLRALAQGVRPSSLDEGLEPALRSLVSLVPLPVDLALEPVPVSEPAATAAYYVAAEAVTNALKHARPARIGIALTRSIEGTRLAVTDDGTGGHIDAIRSGLAGIRDRVEAAGGRLDVTSELGAGTVVAAVFP